MRTLLIFVAFFLLTPSAYAVTYATFNPSDVGSNITLSNGNLTATHDGTTAWNSVRATVSKTTGKWYWEYTIGTQNNNQFTGLFASDTNLNASPAVNPSATYGNNAGNANAYGYLNNTTEKIAAVANGLSTDSVIGFAYDADAGTLQVYKTNSLLGTIDGIGATITYPFWSGFAGNSVTANFGATTMTYTAPAGYEQGLCAESSCTATVASPSSIVSLIRSFWW